MPFESRQNTRDIETTAENPGRREIGAMQQAHEKEALEEGRRSPGATL